MLLAVAEVMFQMVALGLEDVVVFVLDFPAEVVTQDRGVAVLIEGAVLFQPALAGGDLTVLFVVAVLRGDKFGAQGNGIGLAGTDNDGRNGAVIVGNPAAFVLDDRAVLAMFSDLHWH